MFRMMGADGEGMDPAQAQRFGGGQRQQGGFPFASPPERFIGDPQNPEGDGQGGGSSQMTAADMQNAVSGGGEMTPRPPMQVPPPFIGDPQRPPLGQQLQPYNNTPQNPPPQAPPMGAQQGGDQQGGMQGMNGLAGLLQMIQQFHQQQGGQMGQQQGGQQGGSMEQQAQGPGGGTRGFGGGQRGGNPTQGGGQGQGQPPFNFSNLIQMLQQQRQGGFGQQQSFQPSQQMGGQGYHQMAPQQPSGGQYWNYHPQAPPPVQTTPQAPQQGQAWNANIPAGDLGSTTFSQKNPGSYTDGNGGGFQPLPTVEHPGSLYGMPQHGNSNVYSRSEGPNNTYFYNANTKQWGDESNDKFKNQFGG